MNHYYEIAALYFKRFEGAQYSPKWRDWRTLGVLAALVTFFISIYWRFFVPSPPAFVTWLFFGSEVAVIAFALAIMIYRHLELLKTLPDESGIEEDDRVHHAKRNALIDLTKRPASEFLALLEEIKKVQVLEQEHRSKLDPDMQKSFLYFFNLPIWTRLLPLALAGVTIFFGKPQQAASFSISDVINSPHLLSLIWASLQLLVALLALGFVTYVMAQQLSELFALLISTKWPGRIGNATMLNCLMRDLVRFYTPEAKPGPAAQLNADPGKPPTPQAQSKDKPVSVGAALAMFAIKALHSAWLNSKPPLKK